VLLSDSLIYLKKRKQILNRTQNSSAEEKGIVDIFLVVSGTFNHLLDWMKHN
jgi:hypothetical protein